MSVETTAFVIDGGGRGSAIVESFEASEGISKITAIPGNDFMKVGAVKEIETHPELTTKSVTEILELCKNELRSGREVFVSVDQDDAVAAGLADETRMLGIPTMGPGKAAGRLESDKAWAREFGRRHSLPQPNFHIFTSERAGLEFLKRQPDKEWFVKASGLAEGKGAIPAHNNKEAARAVAQMKNFKNGAGEVYLIEDWLKGDTSSGEEFSAFAISDGKRYLVPAYVQDNKRIGNYDEGENTGGMGATSPILLAPGIESSVNSTIFAPAFNGLQDEGIEWNGWLFLGGMNITVDGKPVQNVIEFNARLGDPEAQAILPGIRNDYYELALKVAGGNLGETEIQMDGKTRIVVTVASRGYPGNYDSVKGKEIHGINEIMDMDDITFYGAGIKVDGDRYYASGGRLGYIVGRGDNIIEAREKAYAAASRFHVDGNNHYFRFDIGQRDVQRLYRGAY